MKIKKTLDSNCLTLEIDGRIDTVTAPALEKEFQENYPGASKVIFDFQNVQYISSAGLRVLLVAHKAMAGKGEMIIKNVNEMVMEVFDITGFSDILTIES